MLTSSSLSEYGCNTNKREFQEVASLYSSDMTGVYSGGLVYEYAEEGSKYGLVKINGNSVTELDDFNALKTAYAGTPNPQGDGGYNPNGAASKCPTKSSTFNVDSDSSQPSPSPPRSTWLKVQVRAWVLLAPALRTPVLPALVPPLLVRVP
jgi:hypothetical protein